MIKLPQCISAKAGDQRLERDEAAGKRCSRRMCELHRAAESGTSISGIANNFWGVRGWGLQMGPSSTSSLLALWGLEQRGGSLGRWGLCAQPLWPQPSGSTGETWPQGWVSKVQEEPSVRNPESASPPSLLGTEKPESCPWWPLSSRGEWQHLPRSSPRREVPPAHKGACRGPDSLVAEAEPLACGPCCAPWGGVGSRENGPTPQGLSSGTGQQ